MDLTAAPGLGIDPRTPADALRIARVARVALSLGPIAFMPILTTLAAMALQIAGFPNGREMRPPDAPYTPTEPR